VLQLRTDESPGVLVSPGGPLRRGGSLSNIACGAAIVPDPQPGTADHSKVEHKAEALQYSQEESHPGLIFQ